MDVVDLGFEEGKEQITLIGAEGVGDWIGLDDRGVVGGAGRVEGVFVLLSVKFVDFQVDSKTGFVG